MQKVTSCGFVKATPRTFTGQYRPRLMDWSFMTLHSVFMWHWTLIGHPNTPQISIDIIYLPFKGKRKFSSWQILVRFGLVWSSVVRSGLVGISNKHSWNESVGSVANEAIHGITSSVHQSLIFFSFGVFIFNF